MKYTADFMLILLLLFLSKSYKFPHPWMSFMFHIQSLSIKKNYNNNMCQDQIQECIVYVLIFLFNYFWETFM